MQPALVVAASDAALRARARPRPSGARGREIRAAHLLAGLSFRARASFDTPPLPRPAPSFGTPTPQKAYEAMLPKVRPFPRLRLTHQAQPSPFLSPATQRVPGAGDAGLELKQDAAVRP